MQRLKQRREFLAVSKGLSQATPSLILQALSRMDADPPRVGFTCTKKLGNAVVRNRTRRRLREAARLTFPAHGREGFDYVLVGRAATATRTFEAIQKDIISALVRVHAVAQSAAPRKTNLI